MEIATAPADPDHHQPFAAESPGCGQHFAPLARAPETGLHYNYFRHYVPETGPYLTLDPLDLAPAPNPVTYVFSPHARSDSLGLAPDYPDGSRAGIRPPASRRRSRILRPLCRASAQAFAKA
ncbi:RHS repeat-associated core domain-containing protein [Streptomyces sp. NPDC046881]|uniref:RHS repeat domain-containing protein n=1 Tax=Streptomyces sp. NPDC046881 TaxID=3155374 RepID=UPI0033DACC48